MSETEQAKQAEQEVKTGYFVFVGTEKKSKGGTSYKYILVNSLDETIDYDSSVLYFSGSLHKQFGQGSAGLVVKADYTGEPSGGMSVLGKGRELAGRWKDQEQVIEWQTMQTARDQAAKKEKDLKAVSNFNELKAALDPVKRAAGRMTLSQRAAFLGWLIEYITRG